MRTPHPLPKLPLLAIPLFVAVLGASSCAPYGPGGGYGTNVIYEQEPNDQVWEANWIGGLRPGRSWVIEGFSEAGFDPADGFAFVVDQPCEVELRLFQHDPLSDLDIGVYDPQLGQYVFFFDCGCNPEGGFFEVYEPGVEVHLVVLPAWGATPYSFEVYARPLAEGAGEGAGQRMRRIGEESRPSPELLERARPYGRRPEPIAAPAAPRVPVAELILLDDEGRVEVVELLAPAD